MQCRYGFSRALVNLIKFIHVGHCRPRADLLLTEAAQGIDLISHGISCVQGKGYCNYRIVSHINVGMKTLVKGHV